MLLFWLLQNPISMKFSGIALVARKEYQNPFLYHLAASAVISPRQLLPTALPVQAAGRALSQAIFCHAADAGAKSDCVLGTG